MSSMEGIKKKGKAFRKLQLLLTVADRGVGGRRRASEGDLIEALV